MQTTEFFFSFYFLLRIICEQYKGPGLNHVLNCFVTLMCFNATHFKCKLLPLFRLLQYPQEGNFIITLCPYLILKVNNWEFSHLQFWIASNSIKVHELNPFIKKEMQCSCHRDSVSVSPFKCFKYKN